jgi:aspartate kinase
MNREVWKLGGTSVDTIEKRMLVGRIVAAEAGSELVVVVSAAAGTTDRLIRIVSAIPGVPQDIIDAFVATGEFQSAALIAGSIYAAGRPAEIVPPSLLFSCNDRFGDADVIDVDTAPLFSRFDRGVLPVVPGFVGRSPDGRVCVLGRGGSDYTAMLLGAALRAKVVLLKNDTDGIYTADPNTHPAATRYDRLTHAEALSLSTGGAKVLNGKAAQVAMQERLTVIVRSTFGSGPGTLIAADLESTAAVPEGVLARGGQPACTTWSGTCASASGAGSAPVTFRTR